MTTQFLFFSGKGGVGKTSMACTLAVRLAEEGKRTLIITTDPASNLADVFEQAIGHHITPIAGVPNLSAMEIDSDKAAEEYKERALAPLRLAFPPQMVQVMEEQMAGPCTTEVATFDRFTDFLDVPSDEGQPFDTIIFDTAPTGHTLRLLELPFEWSQTIDAASEGSGQTCIGPAAAIQDARKKYERAMEILRDPEQSTFTFVLHPEAIAIKETRRAITELEKLGIHSYQLIVNGIIPEEETSNPLFSARHEMQLVYLKQIETEFPLPTQYMHLLAGEIKGIERLREVGRVFFNGERLTAEHTEVRELESKEFQIQADALTRLLPGSGRRTLFFAGKGGVGKTISSCITAVWLANRGLKTLLLTTDPAAHLGDVLGVPVGDTLTKIAGIPNLWAANIDPKAAAGAYKKQILDDAAERGRPPEAIKVMAEELDSPCTEEMAAFDKFVDYASQDEWEMIVFDTAPTGHTLRLVELPMDWSQQIDIKVFSTVDTSPENDATKNRFKQVIDMMRDPEQSTFAYVMYPESTPIIEAYRAVEELQTVGINPGLVVVNQVIPSEQATTPFSQSRRAMQVKYLHEIAQRFSVPMVEIPLLPQEVKGLKLLTRLGDRVLGESRTTSAAD